MSDKRIIEVLEDLSNNNKDIPNEVFTRAIRAIRETCKHTNKFSYNHGYHTICQDCGVEL